MIGARFGEIELLGHHRPPAVEKISADRYDQTRSPEVEAWPSHSVALTIRRDHCVIGARIVAEMRRHAETRQPAVEKSGETSALMLVDEDGVCGRSPAPRLSEF